MGFEMFEKVKAVFFDFDDTLQSREGAYRLYCADFLSRYFPEVAGEEKQKMIDEMEEHVDGGYKSREEYWPEMIALWNWKNAPSLEVLTDDFNGEFGKHVVMLDGAVDTIKELKRRGYKLGMITNGDSLLQNMKLDTAGIRDYFDMSVVSDDIGIWKPEAGIFEYAMEQLGVTNEESVFVGDHPINDIQGAKNAHMNVIRMNYGQFYNASIKDETCIKSIPELLDILK